MESVDVLASCISLYSIGFAAKKTSWIWLKSSARLLSLQDQPTCLEIDPLFGVNVYRKVDMEPVPAGYLCWSMS